MQHQNKTFFTIIRHGETEWNLAGRHQGWKDSPLTALGIAQAHAVAEHLGTMARFDRFVSSDLGRAVHTARIISDVLELSFTTDERLRERNLGIMEGLTLAEVQVNYPEVHDNYAFVDVDYAVPGGESSLQRQQRSVACVTEITERFPGTNNLIVAHGGVLSGLFRYCVGVPDIVKRRYSLFNASINRLSVSSEGWFLESWGETVPMREP